MGDATACAGCGSPLEGKSGRGGGPPRKWCSGACRQRAFRRNEPAAHARITARARARQREKYVPVSYDKECIYCSAPFQARRPEAKYCSQPCASRAFHERRIADGRRDVMLKARTARLLNDTERWAREQALAAKRRRRARHGSVRVRAEMEARHAAAGSSGIGYRVIVAGTCPRCGEDGCSVRPLDGSLCDCRGLRLSKRDWSSVVEFPSGQRVRFAASERLAVFERDNWICYLCGDPVDRYGYANDPAAPAVDHVVPLAGGGAHEPSNWRTAHSYCNNFKSDRPLTRELTEFLRGGSRHGRTRTRAEGPVEACAP